MTEAKASLPDSRPPAGHPRRKGVFFCAPLHLYGPSAENWIVEKKPIFEIVSYSGPSDTKASYSGSDRGASMKHVDMVVIGSGPAGQKAAIQAAKLGKSVTLIER